MIGCWSSTYFREPTLNQDCIAFVVTDNNAVQDMALDWKTYDCSKVGESKPICQYPSSNFEFELEREQGIYKLQK